MIFKYTNWQAYSPFFEATEGLIGLKFPLEIETDSDHFYVCLEGLPQTSARTPRTTHVGICLLLTKAEILKNPRSFDDTIWPVNHSFSRLCQYHREQNWILNTFFQNLSISHGLARFLSRLITNLVVLRRKITRNRR